MNIYEARILLPVTDDSITLRGHTGNTEASVEWYPKAPEIVILGCQPEALHYAVQVLPVLKAVRANPRRYQGKRYEHGRFEFGDHVFDLEEIEALDCWIKYYAGPSLFM